jgi:hypothetical protein
MCTINQPGNVFLGIGEGLPKLAARTGRGLQNLPTETPSKRTKKTDESKLLRTVRTKKYFSKKNLVRLMRERILKQTQFLCGRVLTYTAMDL